MTLKLRPFAVLALGLVGLALPAAPVIAHPQYGYGYGYHPRPHHTPRGHGEVVIIQPPVRYAPPPVYFALPPVYYAPPPAYYYAPPPSYHVPTPYPRYGYYGRPGVSLNFRF
ncbi:MAG: hypothetical protein ING09_03845 [Roseomonas sp.]|nr:hypothetical protein [Roseomonas sp.]MCA3289943.1 hypothetical protein [Roseomonas sp.]MCA3292932.1 hypothetical protein [Roseomonas sp.]